MVRRLRHMQSHWANSAPYYRCRFPAEYALANQIKHQLNVCLREDAILTDVDNWLKPRVRPAPSPPDHRRPRSGTRPGRYPPGRSLRDSSEGRCVRPQARPVPSHVGRRSQPGHGRRMIAETQAERARHEIGLRQRATRSRLSHDEVETMIGELGDLAATLNDARTAGRARVDQPRSPKALIFRWCPRGTRNLRTWPRSHWPRSLRSGSHGESASAPTDALLSARTRPNSRPEPMWLISTAGLALRTARRPGRSESCTFDAYMPERWRDAGRL